MICFTGHADGLTGNFVERFEPTLTQLLVAASVIKVDDDIRRYVGKISRRIINLSVHFLRCQPKQGQWDFEDQIAQSQTFRDRSDSPLMRW